MLEAAVHDLRGEPHVIDITTSVSPPRERRRADGPSLRGLEVFQYCFEHGLMVRYTGDTIALGPACIATAEEIERMTATLRAALRAVA